MQSCLPLTVEVNVLRYDVKDFYPSINHRILMSKIKKRCKFNKLLQLIRDAIENPHQYQKQNGLVINNVGIPQGLSISNILSNIYLLDTDKKYESNPNIKYFRFVDDILVLCNNESFENLNEEIQNDFKNLKLKLHTEDKLVKQNISEEFDFLGYTFCNGLIGVRNKSIDKIKVSIINLLSSYHYSKKKNLDRLLFKINLRITGCMVNKNKYGWIFYFSQLNNENILHSLDHFIYKQLKRFNINLNTKKIVKVWKEINLNLHNTRYIPNFDIFKKDQKEKILDLYNIKYTDETVDDEFSALINKEIKKLEKDMSNLS